MKRTIKIIYLLAISMVWVGCGSDFNSDMNAGIRSMPSSGAGGSLARFAIVNNMLYTVDYSNLKVFDITDPSALSQINDVTVNDVFEVETIYPFGQHLFIGTQSGMIIYETGTQGGLTRISEFAHVVSCDPVVTDGKYAYVTLRSQQDNQRCWRPSNQLDILDVQDITNPFLVNSIDMTFPKGLGISDSTLFVCDEGLKVFNVADVMDVREVAHINIPANDVIPWRGVLIVTANDGLYQYRYNNMQLDLLSKLDITPPE